MGAGEAHASSCCRKRGECVSTSPCPHGKFFLSVDANRFRLRRINVRRSHNFACRPGHPTRHPEPPRGVGILLRRTDVTSTIKAVIEHGRIIPLDNVSLPDSCQVLVTIMSPAHNRIPLWDEVKKHLGALRNSVDGQAWQESIRSEWERPGVRGQDSGFRSGARSGNTTEAWKDANAS